MWRCQKMLFFLIRLQWITDGNTQRNWKLPTLSSERIARENVRKHKIVAEVTEHSIPLKAKNSSLSIALLCSQNITENMRLITTASCNNTKKFYICSSFQFITTYSELAFIRTAEQSHHCFAFILSVQRDIFLIKNQQFTHKIYAYTYTVLSCYMFRQWVAIFRE
jgi:hypothetical protein